MGVTRIQHNLSAMNSMSNYQGNQNKLTGNLEKLSSGYRINSAADDAAGLAISEKMRSQIAGLEKAQDNANDGVSLVQTAEGALTEVNSMLTRLKTLATQSANGTYEDGVDRANIQEETEALLSEIDRISESTNFNGIKLLDGSLDGKSQVKNVAITETIATTGKYQLGATSGSAAVGSGFSTGKFIFNATSNTDGGKLSAEDIGKSVSYTVTWKDADGNEKTTTAKLTFQGAGDGTVADLSNSTECKKNYFTDDQGTRYNLDSSAALTPANIQSAVVAGLENDKEFSANFKVSNTTGQLTFETKKTGSDTAQVIGGSSDSNFIDSDTNTHFRKQVAGTNTGTASVAQEAHDSYQRMNIKEQTVVGKGATAKEIEAATFEVDGQKFLLVTGSGAGTSAWSDEDTKALGSDINVVKTTATAAGKFSTATATDAQDLAAAIQQKTGRTAEAFTDPDEQVDGTQQGRKQFDIVFKDNDNRLKTDGNELELQVGDTNQDYQKVSVKIQDMSSKGLGLTGLDLSNQEGAAKAIDTIQNAVNAVSTQRGQLGALQNRLDHTLNNLDATQQNIQAAESQIRDVDMAKEMTQYSKNNILVQAAQSMLAQANSLPQGVLSLLQ